MEHIFSLIGSLINKKGNFWGLANVSCSERQLYALQVTEWCVITSEILLVSNLFENSNGKIVTITGDRHYEILEHFLRPGLLHGASKWLIYRYC